MKKKIGFISERIIVNNKRTQFNFFIEKEFQAGLVLEGWEVKSLRERKVSIKDSYVIFKENEAFLFNANFTPTKTVVTRYYSYNPKRTRKLLLKQFELNSIYGLINRKGYTAIALSLYWKKRWCKVQIGIAKGKKNYEKRFEIKKREWNRYKSRISKKYVS